MKFRCNNRVVKCRELELTGGRMADTEREGLVGDDV